MYWAGDRFECLVVGSNEMSVVDDALEAAARSVTVFVVIPMILFFIVGALTAWMF